MIPVLTPDEMRAVDAAAPESVEELIERAGWAVAIAARRMLGSTYGRRVVCVAGTGNNGADGRVAVRHLERWGVRCAVVDAGTAFDSDRADAEHVSSRCQAADLIIDAGFGTGLRSAISAPDVGTTPVLAVDIASGIDGLTGQAMGRPMAAARTITFAALKPGLLVGDGPAHSGEVDVVDIGLAVDSNRSAALTDVVEESDVMMAWPRRRADAHKWRHAVAVIGGEAGMAGSVALTSAAAFRAGASHVTLARPAVPRPADGEPSPAQSTDGIPSEVVALELADAWLSALDETLRRVAACAIGPGLTDASADHVRTVIASTPGPTVIDAGAINAFQDHHEILVGRVGPTILTPHDGEYRRLMGHAPGGDRVRAARVAAEALDCVVLLKGPTTIVAGPSGDVRLITIGDERLATAGSGDALTGIIVAGLAGGLDALDAASLGATLHAMAARRGQPRGLTAGDLPLLIAACLSDGESQPSVAEVEAWARGRRQW